MTRTWFQRRAKQGRQSYRPRGRAGNQGQLPRLEYLEDRTLLSAGTLDLSFSADGRAFVPFTGNDEARAVVVQPDGKVVVAGSTGLNASGNTDFALTRLNTDGSPDSSFGTNGRITTAFSTNTLVTDNDAATAAALQPDGKIVVAGWARVGATEDFAVARYLPDGSLDTTFGGAGLATFHQSGDDRANAVAVQADGKIFIGGRTGLNASGNYDFLLIRLNAGGSLDTSFGNSGRVTTAFGPSNDQPADNEEILGLTLLPFGAIAAIGWAHMEGGDDFAVTVYEPDGAIATDIGINGQATIDFSGDDRAYAAVLYGTSRLVLAGRTGLNSNGNTDFALARLNYDGTLDSEFGNAGRVTTSFGANDLTSDNEEIRALVAQPGGRLVAAGWAHWDNSDDFALARYNADGSLDPSLAGDGQLTTDFGAGDDRAYAVAVTGDDKLVVAGQARGSGDDDFAVARYENDQLQFGTATFSGNENAGQASIAVTRTGGTTGPLAVNYATADDTAHDGSEYQSVTGTLSFAPGEVSKTFLINLISDSLIKTNRTVTLILSNPSGGVMLGTVMIAALVIVDKDLPVIPDSPYPANIGTAALGFAKSREQYQNLIIATYARYLKRTPDPFGLNAWLELMLAGTVNEERLEAGFIGSAEYIANHGGRGAGWVTGMYQDLLGRTPAAWEVQSWLDALAAGMTEPQVAYGFAASREREGQRVQRNYQTYLGRSASQAEVDSWVDLFAQGKVTNQDIIAGFVGSPEYYNSPVKGKGNRAVWIANAYEQVLFRSPALWEVNTWLAYLT